MALIKSYTDICGNDYQDSYWRAVKIDIDAYGSRIGLTFFGFKNGEAFASGKQQLAGAVKVYTITGDEFAQIAASTPVGSSLYEVLAHSAEAYALGKLDTDGKSFFDGATQV